MPAFHRTHSTLTKKKKHRIQTYVAIAPTIFLKKKTWTSSGAKRQDTLVLISW
jgi:hypothetical protein